MHIRLLGGARAVRVDHDQPGAAGFFRPGHVGHDVDLSVHRVGAPDHDQIRVHHLLADHAPAPAVPGAPADVGKRHADRGVPARIAHGVAQPVDAVALHQTHGAGVEIGPDGLRPVLLHLAHERFGDLVQRIVPGDRRKRARAFRANPAQRLEQPVGVVKTLGVTRDFGADHAGGVRIALRALDLTQAPAVQLFHVERTNRRAVVRTDGRSIISAPTPTGPGGLRPRRSHGCRKFEGRARRAQIHESRPRIPSCKRLTTANVLSAVWRRYFAVHEPDVTSIDGKIGDLHQGRAPDADKQLSECHGST